MHAFFRWYSLSTRIERRTKWKVHVVKLWKHMVLVSIEVKQSIWNISLSRDTISNLDVKIRDDIILEVTRFRHLRSIIENDREIEGWLKWRSALDIICDKKRTAKI